MAFWAIAPPPVPSGGKRSRPFPTPSCRSRSCAPPATPAWPSEPCRTRAPGAPRREARAPGRSRPPSATHPRRRPDRAVIHDDIAELAAALPPGLALAGLDLGEKTIGIAVSDRLLGTATPVSTLRQRKFSADATALLDLLAEREAGGLILGLPRNMDGSEGPRCQSTRAF